MLTNTYVLEITTFSEEKQNYAAWLIAAAKKANSIARLKILWTTESCDAC